MLPAYSIFENVFFSAFSGMEYIFLSGKSLNWIASGTKLNTVLRE